THRDCGLKGGNSRCQQKERKRPRKNQRRKRSTNALVRFTAPKLFGAKTQTLAREENLFLLPVFFCAGVCSCRQRRRQLQTPDKTDSFSLCTSSSLCELISHEALSRRRRQSGLRRRRNAA